ncbi:uncharacterized protein CLUP02_01027, partial [Colletotrichum lupini]
SSLKKSSPPHAVSSLYYSGLPPRASFPLYSLVGSSPVSPSRHGTPTLHLVKLLNSKSKPKPGTARTPPDLSNSQRPRVALVPNHTKTLFALSQPSSSLPNSPPLFPLARHPPPPPLGFNFTQPRQAPSPSPPPYIPPSIGSLAVVYKSHEPGTAARPFRAFDHSINESRDIC